MTLSSPAEHRTCSAAFFFMVGIGHPATTLLARLQKAWLLPLARRWWRRGTSMYPGSLFQVAFPTVITDTAAEISGGRYRYHAGGAHHAGH